MCVCVCVCGVLLLIGYIYIGWWRYDDRTNEDIETAYKLAYETTEILICGELYIIDLAHNYQYPKRNPSRKRFIKRDTNNIPVKGIAGVPVTS